MTICLETEWHNFVFLLNDHGSKTEVEVVMQKCVTGDFEQLWFFESITQFLTNGPWNCSKSHGHTEMHFNWFWATLNFWPMAPNWVKELWGCCVSKKQSCWKFPETYFGFESFKLRWNIFSDPSCQNFDKLFPACCGFLKKHEIAQNQARIFEKYFKN